MLKKAKVVNISFADKIKQSFNTRSSQLQDIQIQEPELNLQNFMKSRQTTQSTYELIKIIKASPLNLNDLLKRAQQQNPSYLSLSQKTSSQKQQMDTIYPEIQMENVQKSSNKSFSAQVSKATTIFVSQDSQTQVNENMFNEQRKTVPIMKFNQFSQFNKSSLKERKNIQSSLPQNFYLIPSKYQTNLNFILTHFLNYKVFALGKQNPLGTSSISKRPKTTSKNTQSFNIKQRYTTTESKPLTAISQNHTTNSKPINQQDNLTNDFNNHLQKMMQMQMQLQRKSKRIVFLQNELMAFSNAIKDKNQQIKSHQQKEIVMKKKFKYQVDKMMKGKVLTDINDIFLSNFNESNANGKSIFQINGKKFIKSSDVNCWIQNSFLTAPRGNLFQNENSTQSNFKTNNSQPQGNQTMKKSQSMVLMKRAKPSNKRLQISRVSKVLQSLTKQVMKFNVQKQAMLDKLAQNNSKIQKYIQKIEFSISSKKSQIQKYTDELGKLRNCSQFQ